MKQYYAIQQAERNADIYIFGDIVPYEMFDGDVSSNGIIEQIKNLDVDVINVHINSYGGSVSEGWAIYSALIEHPAKVNTYGDGFVASAALYPFMAGENRYASNLSAYYFHQVMISATGYAKDLRAAANEAELMTKIGMSAFTERAGMGAEEVEELMENEVWLSPKEALERNIATAIMADNSQKYVQDAKKIIMQKLVEPSDVPDEKPKEENQEEQNIVQESGNSVMSTLAGFFNV